MKYAEIVASDFDIEGQLQIIVNESDSMSKILDSEWRTKAITVLEKFKSTLKERAYPADFIFNAAQVCRQLQQYQLAEDMTNAAFDKDPSPPIKALKLASEVRNRTGQDRQNAYSELLRMVEELDYESSPHIVLAEAWNAAESIKKYEPLIDSLGMLITSRSEDSIPSFAYAIKAAALLRLGRASAKQQALPTLEDGYRVYQGESAYSQWSGEFKNQYLILAQVAQEARTIDPTAPVRITEELEQFFRRFREPLDENHQDEQELKSTQ